LHNDILIDAPAGISITDPISKIIITHEHCDHFAGLDEIRCSEVLASEFCAKIINEKRSDGLCGLVGFAQPKKKVTRAVLDGENIEGDGCSLLVIETPGHAKGAVCLYDEDMKILFSGDTVFPDMGMPRTDLPTSEPEKLAGTYEKLAALDIDAIYPGHGNEIREKKYIKKLMEKEI
jgi:glyoxylase-like metal-dependent hydrolase (beta-lactamase superfamily II)